MARSNQRRPLRVFLSDQRRRSSKAEQGSWEEKRSVHCLFNTQWGLLNFSIQCLQYGKENGSDWPVSPMTGSQSAHFLGERSSCLVCWPTYKEEKKSVRTNLDRRSYLVFGLPLIGHKMALFASAYSYNTYTNNGFPDTRGCWSRSVSTSLTSLILCLSLESSTKMIPCASPDSSFQEPLDSAEPPTSSSVTI